MAASFSWVRGTRSRYISPCPGLRAYKLQPRPDIYSQRHGIGLVPAHLLPAVAEMGVMDYNGSLRGWLHGFDISCEP